MSKFTGSTGIEFVALQLALDFEDFDGINKKEEDKTAVTNVEA